MHLLQLSGLWKKCAAVCGGYFWNILTLECEEIALVYNETALNMKNIPQVVVKNAALLW